MGADPLRKRDSMRLESSRALYSPAFLNDIARANVQWDLRADRRVKARALAFLDRFERRFGIAENASPSQLTKAVYSGHVYPQWSESARARGA